jgi:uncharacterized RDD family membrane protein YckC
MTGPVVNPYAPPAVELEHGWEAPESGFRNARLRQRWAGAVLDQLLFLGSGIPAAVVALSLDGSSKIYATAAVALVTVLPFAVVQFYLIAKTGQSLGKKICKTRIVRLDGSPPGFVYGVVIRAWAIWAASAIPGIGSFIGLADAVLVFRADRRCLHDHLAGTRVIQT